MLIGTRGKNIEYWSRAVTGPICFEADFDKKVYWPAVKRITEKYEIKYTPDQMVPLDDDMLDRLWEAGIELFLEVGILCVNTRRIMKFTRKEVMEHVNNTPDRFTVGRGQDEITCVHRDFEDYDHVKNPPFVRGRILGPISQDLYHAIAMSFAQVPYLDICDFQGNLTEIYGMPITPGSPWEMFGELWSVAQVRDACRQTCRPGLSDAGIRTISLASQMSIADPGWGLSKGDSRTCQGLPHLKVEYSHLCRSLFFSTYGINTWQGMSVYIGGLSGSPANSIVTGVAEWFAATMAYNNVIMGSWSCDAMYFSNTSKYALWASNHINACVNKHTHCPPMSGGGWQMNHCIGSEEFFWESAASAISSVVLGGGVVGGTGCQSGGRDQSSGLGIQFSAEVGMAVARARLTRAHANELVKTIMKKYQPNIDNHTSHTIGGDFRDCYDLTTVQPKKFYWEIYEKVKKELTAMGLPMD